MSVATCYADQFGGSPCDWSAEDSETNCKIMSVLHVIDKHPDLYSKHTGRDPDVVKFTYEDQFNRFKGRY